MGTWHVQSYRCNLCNLGTCLQTASSNIKWSVIIKSAKHSLTKYVREQNAASGRRRHVQSLEPRIACLGSSVWQNDVKLHLLSYLMDEAMSTRPPNPVVLEETRALRALGAHLAVGTSSLAFGLYDESEETN